MGRHLTFLESLGDQVMLMELDHEIRHISCATPPTPAPPTTSNPARVVRYRSGGVVVGAESAYYTLARDRSVKALEKRGCGEMVVAERRSGRLTKISGVARTRRAVAPNAGKPQSAKLINPCPKIN